MADMHKHIAHKHTNLMNKIKGFKRTKYRHFEGAERMKIATLWMSMRIIIYQIHVTDFGTESINLTYIHRRERALKTNQDEH